MNKPDSEEKKRQKSILASFQMFSNSWGMSEESNLLLKGNATGRRDVHVLNRQTLERNSAGFSMISAQFFYHSLCDNQEVSFLDLFRRELIERPFSSHGRISLHSEELLEILESKSSVIAI